MIANFYSSKTSKNILPKCDTYDLTYYNWVRQLDWGSENDIKRSKYNIIQNELSEFDFLIGLGHAPAFLNIVNRKLDVMNPYGGIYSVHQSLG